MYNFCKPQKGYAMNVRIEGNARVANTTVLVSFHKHHNVLLAQITRPIILNLLKFVTSFVNIL